MPAGIYDTFLLDQDGHMLEGLAANFYAIVDGELWTAGQNVLKGIARQIVLEIAPPIVPVREEAPHVSAVERFSDAFLTSASRGIIPVVEIDGIRIGQGEPGTLTRQLMAAYQAWVNRHLEDL
jgi:branched-chain amino acid aminotransferase